MIKAILGLFAVTTMSVAAYAAATRVSSPCANSNCVRIAATAAPGIKWHPGHYMSIRDSHRHDDIDLQYVRQLATEPTITGILRDWEWRDVEPKKGVYDFSEIDDYLKVLKAMPTLKRFIIRIENRIFVTHKGNAVPDYMLSDPAYLGGQAPMANGVVARIWEAPVMDRLIALHQALAARYDSEPLVEGISTSETAIGFSSEYPAPSTFSTGALLEQLERLIAASRAAWPHSNVFADTNYLGHDAQMEAFIVYCANQQAVIGGPDVVPDRALQSDQIMRGELGAARDYRGVVAIKAEIQASELGLHWSYLPNALYAEAYTINRSNYILWDRNDYYGDANQQWARGILPFIRSVNGRTVTTCPASFHGRCMTN